MPRLTEQEQQEIIRFIEADKPLPEKYRFLLFIVKPIITRTLARLGNLASGRWCGIVVH